MFWDNILRFKNYLQMSLKIFWNKIFVRHVNLPRHNWKKIRQSIFLVPFFIYVENTRNKGAVILERQTITAELLHIKLANRLLLFFVVWNDGIKPWNSMNWMFGKSRHDFWFFCPHLTLLIIAILDILFLVCMGCIWINMVLVSWL